MHLNHLPGPASQFPGCDTRDRLRHAMCLLWGADLRLLPPGQIWLVARNLLIVWWRMPVSGAEIDEFVGEKVVSPSYSSAIL